MIQPHMDGSSGALSEWSRSEIGEQIDAATQALSAYCKKPKSTKRLHSARKRLARLRAVLEDLGRIAGVSGTFPERVRVLHKRAGKVRDTDVLLARVDKYAECATGKECDELQFLRKSLRKRRKRMRRKLERELRA